KVLPMKRVAFFLILLLTWAQVDDVWALVPVSPSAALADNDEYLPAQRQREVKASASRKQPVSIVRHAQGGDSFSPAAVTKPAHSLFAALSHSSSVYVFMSLRR